MLIVVDLCKLVVPGLRRWENSEPRTAAKLARIVLVLALFSAVIQAGEMASGLESISALVAEPGLLFRLPAIATLIAGTVLVTWLARQITRRGLGSGLWLINVAPTLAGLPLTLKQISDFEIQGVVSGPSLVAAAVFTVLAIAAVAALQLAGRNTASTPSAYAWTTILGYTILPWLLVPLSWLVGARASDGSMPWVEPGHQRGSSRWR
jgi:preprotein translocase subunit SecY